MKINVVVTTYNHEKYITQCLESILNQKGDFQMEIIIGDDASIDSTRQIAEQYQAKYPRIVYLLPPEKNLGITKNLKRCLDACTGEYIAICEGDDYWTDVYKLQKQKELLDEHPDFSMCFSAFIIYHESKNVFEAFQNQMLLKKDVLSTEDLIEDNSIGNFSSCMYRTEVIKQLPDKLFDIFTVDWMFNMVCGQFGSIGFIRDWMSVYRKHEHGAWAGGDKIENQKKLVQLMNVYNEFFNYKYDALFVKKRGLLESHISHSQENLIAEEIKHQSLNKQLTVSDKTIESSYANQSQHFVWFLHKIGDWLRQYINR